MPRRVDLHRIAAITLAIGFHVMLALALLVPSRPLLRSDDTGSLVVDVVPSRTEPPRPATAPAPVTPRERPAPAKASPPAGTRAPAPSNGIGDAAPATWAFDPSQDITVVVYSQRPTLDLAAADLPPAEIPGYRAGFEPSDIEGLNGPNADGSVLFDVLVDESGVPSAVVPVERNCSERAFETAMAVISQWRFVPATFSGTPVQGWLQVRLEF